MYKNIDKSKYTPMMRQYLDIKEKYPDTLVFFRLGDFYEMFFNDAIVASRELEIVLTGRDAGVEERVPMCGVPFHSVDIYIQKLTDKGYKVAIVEQLDAPNPKKIVERDACKKRLCEENGVILKYIRYDEDVEKALHNILDEAKTIEN